MIHLISDSFGRWGQGHRDSFHDQLVAETRLPVRMTVVGGSATNLALREWAARVDKSEARVVVWLIPSSAIAGNDMQWAAVNLSAGRVLRLADMLEQCSILPPGTVVKEIGKSVFPVQTAITADLPGAHKRAGEDLRPHRLAWSRVQLGETPRFRTDLGLIPAFDLDPKEQSDGVEFQLRIDGRIVAVPRRSAPKLLTWIDWSVDLGEFAGRTVDLELRVEPLESAWADFARWGNPEIWDAQLN